MGDSKLDAVKLIGGIMGAATGVIARIVELVGSGEVEQAQEVVDLFVATTKTQLDNDYNEAEGILRQRFPGSQPPEAG